MANQPGCLLGEKMKKYLALVILNATLLVGALPLHASVSDKLVSQPAKHMAVTIDPIKLFFGVFIHQMEMAFSDKLALTIPIGAIVPSFSLFRFAALPQFGWLAGTGAGLKYYFIGQALSGVYLHPQVTLSAGQMGTPTVGKYQVVPGDAVFALAASYSVTLGYAWATSNGFFLDAYAGMTHMHFLTNPPPSTPPAPTVNNVANLTGINPYVGLLIGYAW
jgi:hypothetical protein